MSDELYPCPNPPHWLWLGSFYFYLRWAKDHWAEKPDWSDSVIHYMFQLEWRKSDRGPRIGLIIWKLKLIIGHNTREEPHE